MAWFRLEGRGAFHHKVIAAGDEAYGAWVRAGQWSCDQLTDGFIPKSTAFLINRRQKVWGKLVEVRLLHEADGGYQIHDFLDWNPPSEHERARREIVREKRREAGKLGGIRSGEARRNEANAKQSASGLVEENAKQTRSNDQANAKQVIEATRSTESESESESESEKEQDPPHTHAPARESTPTSDPEPMTREDLAAVLAEFDPIAKFASDASAVSDLYGAFQMNSPAAFMTVDNTRRIFATLCAKEPLRDMPHAARRSKVATALTYAYRNHKAAQRDDAAKPVHHETREALRLFGEAWSRVKKKPFVESSGDLRNASELAEEARKNARIAGNLRPSEIITHWSEAYARDKDPFVANPEHPLRLLLSRLTSYGLPRVRAPKDAVNGNVGGGNGHSDPEPPPPSAADREAIRVAAREAMAKIGQGGVAERPSVRRSEAKE